jgi:hypothetical protein
MRSGVSSTSDTPPEPLSFFVDRSFGSRRVYETLAGAAHAAVRHDDWFAQDAHDVEWLTFVGKHGLIAVTRDTRIRTRRSEQAAIVAGNVRAFIFSSDRLGGSEAAELVLRAAPRMLKIASNQTPPFAYAVTRGPDFRQIGLPTAAELGIASPSSARAPPGTDSPSP